MDGRIGQMKIRPEEKILQALTVHRDFELALGDVMTRRSGAGGDRSPGRPSFVWSGESGPAQVSARTEGRGSTGRRLLSPL